jgi:hypothetical protein
MTTQENKENILAELFLNYKNDDNFTDFISYNDIGLPLAYAISAGIVKGTDLANRFIDETFLLLLNSLEVEDDGFETLDDIFMVAG